MIFRKIIRTVSLGGCCFLLGVLPLQGAESTVTMNFSLSQSYNDNILLEENKIADAVLTGSPRLEWDHQTEKTETTVSAGMEGLHYFREDELDRVNQQYSLNHDNRMSERFGATLQGSYVNDTTLGSELEETGRLLYFTDRKYYSVMPGIYGYPDDKTRVDLVLGYSRKTYEKKDYSDYIAEDASLELTRTVSDRGATITAHAGYTYNDYDDYYYKIDNYRLYLGTRYPLTENLTITGWAGVRYTDSEYRLVKAETTSNSGGIGFLSIQRKFEKGSISISATEDIAASGRPETIKQTRYDLNIGYFIAEHLYGKLNGRFISTISESDYMRAGETEEELYMVGPALNWRFRENTRLNLSYKYSRINQKYGDISADQNVVFLSLAWNRDWHN